MRKVHNTCDLSVIARMQHISSTTLPECKIQKIQFVFCKAFFHACFWGITGGIIRYQLTPEGVQKMPLFLACLNVIRGFGQHQQSVHTQKYFGFRHLGHATETTLHPFSFQSDNPFQNKNYNNTILSILVSIINISTLFGQIHTDIYRFRILYMKY